MKSLKPPNPSLPPKPTNRLPSITIVKKRNKAKGEKTNIRLGTFVTVKVGDID